ncbi:hypothetical protein [Bradyrhizobium sp. dw_78]|uniref:hypothetical protein n=1 Tax=Bradyrhizobium sp. dw_78 TaxID=2719793 RepID=UPI001BD1F7C5|nr:hypothetical protein [Bradyrhizobium sp. dw_78]
MSFGVLTLATMDDYLKAIGLALSLRVSNSDVPLAVACSPKVRPYVAPYFDLCVDEDPELKGFVHKIHLDRYSPFDETFFFDSDVFIFRPLKGLLNDWRTQSYSACGKYTTDGISPFGLDTEAVLRKIGRKALVQIDGAGHAYFRKPECVAIFDLARTIAADYRNYAGNIKFADEDVMNITMTLLDLRPMPHFDFWSRPLSARGKIDIDATNGKCAFELMDTGQKQEPVMMHFAANEAAFLYVKQLRRLFNKFGVPARGLTEVALKDFYLREMKWPIKARVDIFKAWLSEQRYFSR